MARIRTIKPEFWADEKLAPLSPIDRLVFLGLISQADDAGRLVDNPRLLDGLLFPMTNDTCAASLETLARLQRIFRYRSASGQLLIQIVNWNAHQRVDHPSTYTLPAPTCELPAPHTVTEPSPESTDTLATPSRDSRAPTSTSTNDLRPVPTSKARKRALPDDWKPTEQHVALANELGVVVSREVDNFRDHAIANGRRMVDWDRCFNTWLRNAKKFDRTPKPAVNEKPRQDAPRGDGPRRLTVANGGAVDSVDLEIETVQRWERTAPKATVAKVRQEAADAIAAEPETAELVKALGPSSVAGKVEARYRRLVLELIGRAA